MKQYYDYPKQIYTLKEMIDEYKQLKVEMEKLGKIYEYEEDDTCFNYNKWFDLKKRTACFPDLDMIQKRITCPNELINEFEKWKKLECQNAFFNDRKGMPILTDDYDIIFYSEPNPVYEMNSTFLGTDLNGNKKSYNIENIHQHEFNKYWPDGEKIYSYEELSQIEKSLKKSNQDRKILSK